MVTRIIAKKRVEQVCSVEDYLEMEVKVLKEEESTTMTRENNNMIREICTSIITI